ncbi:hypothetical protein COL154_013050 [Colletotrichum chrysophilum]|uniref:uncharacterized protein n=1 Tax=Colletotrichum chrysophilum TaxID=1836956 RepID=UPI00230041E4|nr:uncharacterized protein COL26b_014172 [Colletotrichum chrysophilum]KAJ0351167.1 hypothetical protein COL154_013050 [Colletotrichum chrysophilum]KAJ0360112.1 hypothetical protein COL26b_014172 [Colletotrichum chrysophilum]
MASHRRAGLQPGPGRDAAALAGPEVTKKKPEPEPEPEPAESTGRKMSTAVVKSDVMHVVSTHEDVGLDVGIEIMAHPFFLDLFPQARIRNESPCCL